MSMKKNKIKNWSFYWIIINEKNMCVFVGVGIYLYI